MGKGNTMKKQTLFSFVHINGRFVVDFGITVEQYMVLTDEELADYPEHDSETDADDEL